MSLTGHNFRRRNAEVKKEPVISTVAEVKDKVEAKLEPIDEPATKPIHKKTGKK